MLDSTVQALNSRFAGRALFAGDAGDGNALADTTTIYSGSVAVLAAWKSIFGDAAEELLAGNLPPERIAAMRSRLDRLNRLYRDVEAGDRYRLTYVPGEGTTLSYNGQPLGTIADPRGTGKTSASMGLSCH